MSLLLNIKNDIHAKITPFINSLKNQLGVVRVVLKYLSDLRRHLKNTLRLRLKSGKQAYLAGIILDLIIIASVLLISVQPARELISPLVQSFQPLQSLPTTEEKLGHEVFGFAPHWTIDRLDNVDFNVLTTLAYFGIDVDGNGNLDKKGKGYEVFMSPKATALFKKAHSHNTRVVLTITQMSNSPIKQLLESEAAQDRAIEQTVAMVKSRGLDGVNVDLEYTGDPGPFYRNQFSKFVAKMTKRMHEEVPNSKVTVSVYASAVKYPKIYDIGALAKSSDGIFMMAYDFAVTNSQHAIPTAPLYGHKEGKYWYDISTAVEDFLVHMPANKLILGVPYYGYNYLVYNPEIKAQTKGRTWGGRPAAQTYSIVQDHVVASREGWDDHGKVGYKAYYDNASRSWRMVFSEDTKSLGIKYDFAKEQNLKGVGMWALGFDNGKKELWGLLSEKFGSKLSADSNLAKRGDK
jgi:spore germination protein YaaH